MHLGLMATVWLLGLLACTPSGDEADDPMIDTHAVDGTSDSAVVETGDTGTVEDTHGGDLLLAPIAGVIVQDLVEEPLAGVRVGVWGHPDMSTVTDLQGRWELQVPVGLNLLKLTQTDFLAVIFAVDVPKGGRAGLGNSLATLEQYAMKLETSLGRTFDPTRGVVSVTFSTPSTMGGESAVISTPSDPPITEDVNYVMQESPVLLPDGHHFISFTNAVIGVTSVTTDGAVGFTSCALRYPERPNFPVEASTFTSIPVDCEVL